MTVRSHRLFGPHELAGTSGESLAVVPAGEVWILKSVRVVNTGAAVVTFRLGLAPIGTDGALFWEVPVDPFTVLVDRAWQVFEAGDELAVQADVASLTVWGSGARLSG